MTKAEGPWQHLPGAWQSSGLWRCLGLGDLKMIPDVTLCCEVQFQELTEVLAFFKAVKALAADTIDGHVTFKKLTFKDEVKTLFPGHNRVVWPLSTDQTTVVFDGYQMECFLTCFFQEDDEESDKLAKERQEIDADCEEARREVAQSEQQSRSYLE
ncbi:unnamed protein product, partial [Cladocopium goreaui]